MNTNIITEYEKNKLSRLLKIYNDLWAGIQELNELDENDYPASLGELAGESFGLCSDVIRVICENNRVGKWMLDNGVGAENAAVLLLKLNPDKAESPAQFLSYAGLSSRDTSYSREVNQAVADIGTGFAYGKSNEHYYDIYYSKYEEIVKANKDIVRSKAEFKAMVYTEKQFIIDLYNFMTTIDK